MVVNISVNIRPQTYALVVQQKDKDFKRMLNETKIRLKPSEAQGVQENIL